MYSPTPPSSFPHTPLLLTCLLLCGCQTPSAYRGGVIEATAGGIPLRVQQPESPKTPAVVHIRVTEGAQDGVRKTTLSLCTGVSQPKTAHALKAFGGWRIAGGLVFLLGMVLLGWRAIPNLAAIALCASGVGLGTLSYVIPTYGVWIALVGLLGALLALLLWWTGLKTDPKTHPHIVHSRILKRLL